MTLSEFLLARIAEDEAIARGALPWATGSRHEGQPFEFAWSLHMDRGGHPARVLAECEAKRRIVQMWKKADHDPFRSELPSGRAKARALELVLMHLALPYAGHPDYCQEWKP